MPRQKLEDALRALADEIEQNQALDDHATGEIRDAIQEIREALDGDDAGPLDELRERMTEASQDFQESHPTLARSLGRISDLLSRMGL